MWDVEHRLTKAFDRTSRWKALLLFDEAEMFMAKRTDEDLKRNAMVSCEFGDKKPPFPSTIARGSG